MGVGDRIKKSRENAGWSQGRLGDAVGVGQTTVSSWERGRTEPTRDEVGRIAKALNISTADLELDDPSTFDRSHYVPIRGYIGADNEGRVIYSEGDEPGDLAPIPYGGTDKAHALVVKGDSMGEWIEEGSLIYYEHQLKEPTSAMIRKVVVAALDTGEVVVKRLVRGSRDGLWDLESANAGPRRDVRLKWVARITGIIPADEARRLIIRAGAVAA